jgi:hypothetical protein
MYYCNRYNILRVLLEELADIKGVMKIRISKKDRQNNGRKKRDKMAIGDLQNTSQKTKHRTARTPIKNWSELRCCLKKKHLLLL